MICAIGTAVLNTGEDVQLQEHILVISEVFKVDEDPHLMLTRCYMCSLASGCLYFREHFFVTEDGGRMEMTYQTTRCHEPEDVNMNMQIPFKCYKEDVFV